MTNASMEEVYKAEIEALRKVLSDCYELLFKYGWKFEENDQEKTKNILVSIKKPINNYMRLDNKLKATF